MPNAPVQRSEEHTSEFQSRRDLVCRLLLEKKKTAKTSATPSAKASTHAAAGTPKTPPTPVLVVGVISPLTRLAGAVAVAVAFLFFNDTATTEIYTLSLHDALPI